MQKQFDLEKATEVENELKMLKERKRQVQEINKQVWLDQIALNKKHKQLNLWDYKIDLKKAKQSPLFHIHSYSIPQILSSLILVK